MRAMCKYLKLCLGVKNFVNALSCLRKNIAIQKIKTRIFFYLKVFNSHSNLQGWFFGAASELASKNYDRSTFKALKVITVLRCFFLGDNPNF